MQNIYSKEITKTTHIEAKEETISFLLAFSKSLQITDVQGVKFESNLN